MRASQCLAVWASFFTSCSFKVQLVTEESIAVGDRGKSAIEGATPEVPRRSFVEDHHGLSVQSDSSMLASDPDNEDVSDDDFDNEVDDPGLGYDSDAHYHVPDAAMLQTVTSPAVLSCAAEADIRREVERIIFEDQALPYPTTRLNPRQNPARVPRFTQTPYEIPGREAHIKTSSAFLEESERTKTLGTVLRAIFHDAQDRNSLMAHNSSWYTPFERYKDAIDLECNDPNSVVFDKKVKRQHQCEELCRRVGNCLFISFKTSGDCMGTSSCHQQKVHCRRAPCSRNSTILRRSNWVPTDGSQYVNVQASGSYGGLDGCMVAAPNCQNPNECTNSGTTANKMNKVIPKIVVSEDSEHENSRVRFFFAMEACKTLCCYSKSPLTLQDKAALCGEGFPPICTAKRRFKNNSQSKVQMLSNADLQNDKCMLDMTVLGSLIITSKVAGPNFPNISMTWGRRQANCSNVFGNLEVQPGLNRSNIALHGSPMRFEAMDGVIDHFARMGFNEEEAAALMGAHSFAKQHKYGGIWHPRNNGHGYCNSSRGGEHAVGTEKWGYGNFWDRTPNNLDNDYFKLLDEANISDETNCCGGMAEFGCSTTYESLENVDLQQGCRHQWCMRSAGTRAPRNAASRDWALLSTQYSRDQFDGPPMMFDGVPRPTDPVRLVRLAADQVLIHNNRSRQAVARFAANNSAFLEAYAAAFGRLINLGQVSLNRCRPSENAFELFEGPGRLKCATTEGANNRLSSTRFRGYEDCETKCADEPRCAYFATNKKRCSLYETCCSRAGSRGGTRIYKKMNHQGPAVWAVHKDASRFFCAAEPSYLANTTGSTVMCQAECQKLCAAIPECNFATFKWTGRGANCFLTTSCTLATGHEETFTVYEK